MTTQNLLAAQNESTAESDEEPIMYEKSIERVHKKEENDIGKYAKLIPDDTPPQI